MPTAACNIHEQREYFLNRHLPIVSRHILWNRNLASPRNLRLGTLVLLLIMVNQINDPLMEATFGEAFLYWSVRPLVMAGGLWLADGLIARSLAGRWNNPAWLKPVLLVSMLGLLPFALTEALLEQHLPFRPEFLDEGLWAFSPVLALLGEFVTAASIVIPIHLLLWLIIDRNVPPLAAAVDTALQSVPQFLERASNLRAEDVLALQAEEHYVRIYSGDGSQLVHCRFGDAVEEMPPELGLQVHRSWWVAESAVRAAQRGQRRWQLELTSDVTVPVSDSFVAAARARGWLKRKPKQPR